MSDEVDVESQRMKAELVWEEIRAMAKDYAVAAEIRVHVHHASHALDHVYELVTRMDMSDSADALGRAWALVLQILGPIMEIGEIDDFADIPRAGSGVGERDTASGERSSDVGDGADGRRPGAGSTGEEPSG